MKDIILTTICVLTLFMCGCKSFMFSHNANQFLNGDFVKVGFGDYGLTFGRGTALTLVVRENTELKVDMKDGNDFSGAPTTKLDSVKSLSFRTGPQVTGYLVDLAGVAPDAASDYVKEMPKINKSYLSTMPSEPLPKKSAGEKSTSDNYIDYLKAKLASISGGAAMPTLSEIKGDGEYNNLYADRSITAQAALTTELLKYADDETMMPTSGETIKDCLVHYAGRLAQLKAKGRSEATKITLNRATIKDGKLTYLMLRLKNDDGTFQDEECANCFELE